ncbi:PREDICTED: mucin-5AC [Polistes dominula]|uniref:Mucin-5AC n=1 Tax=Polistes dominula TaxID=743375 RepID=A0ABM1ITL3_POLDO|nr:PREDICTED: mucin-5AC [Polistes dominula]XP_015183550.1 PREDICTED: mucin-5AC [Polistes dominula]
MSTAVRERTSTHTSRKIVSHGGPISNQSHSSVTAGSLENNLDALLEDLQTSVSRSATPSRSGRALSPQVEYRVAANPTRVVTEGRTVSPTRTTTTTTEKYVSTGPSGAPSGIPGLELLDAELQNVQPGQSKTVAYKQVSYQYNKSIDGKPVDSWAMADNAIMNNVTPMIDNIHETTYEENKTQTRHRSPEPVVKKSTVNRELVFSDTSASRTMQTSPPPGTQYRDVKYIHDSSSYQTEPRPIQSTVTTVHANTGQEYGNVEYVPVPSPTPAIPINLAPGPNTKVTTTIKTYTYELPGAPETYLPGGTLPGGAVLPGDQTITYTLPRTGTSTTDKTVTYQTVTENIPGDSGSPIKYSSPPPIEVTKKSTALHKETKFYREDHHGLPPSSGGTPPQNYHPGSPPVPLPQTNIDSRTTVTRNEKYYHVDGNFPNGQGPPSSDRPDYPGNTTIVYQNQPPVINETHMTTINRIEEHYPSRPPSAGRHPTPDKPGTPTRTNYYPVQSQGTPPGSTTVYKFSNTTTTIPPNKNPEDHEVLLPKPFPTGGVQVYPVNAKPSGPSTDQQGPPARLEDLMASFSDSEREVLENIEKKEKEQQKKDSPAVKKEVDFLPHTPPKVKSKNVAGPPVYYPPGSAEFTKKEEYGAAMSQSSGGWQKGSAKYEYEASSKSKSKSSSGAAVVPVCLPLCCALPCVIM